MAAARAGLSFADIGAAIQARDAKVSAGQLRAGDREWLMEVSGELDTLASLGDTVVLMPPLGMTEHEVARLTEITRAAVDETTRTEAAR